MRKLTRSNSKKKKKKIKSLLATDLRLMRSHEAASASSAQASEVAALVAMLASEKKKLMTSFLIRTRESRIDFLEERAPARLHKRRKRYRDERERKMAERECRQVKDGF